MNTRQNLYELAAQHQLTAAQTRQLLQLSPLVEQPRALAWWLPRGVAVLAAALGGLGVVMWIAANWETLGRMGRFGLLEILVLAAGLGAAMRPAARAPLGLLALLGIGALFAYFGQTYQTGADPWQLFALWGFLALPLCLGARSDVLWAPWSVVVLTAIALWTNTHTGHRWSVEPNQLNVHLWAWGATVAVAVGLSPGLQRWTGAGVWGFRTGVTLAVGAITLTALGGLFFDNIGPQFGLGMLVLVVSAAALCLRRHFDVFALSAIALGLNALVVGGLVRWLFESNHESDWIGQLLLIGLVAAGLLGASVSAILKLSKRYTTTTQEAQS